MFIQIHTLSILQLRKMNHVKCFDYALKILSLNSLLYFILKIVLFLPRLFGFLDISYAGSYKIPEVGAGSEVKSVDFSSRGSEFNFTAARWWLTTIYNENWYPLLPCRHNIMRNKQNLKKVKEIPEVKLKNNF